MSRGFFLRAVSPLAASGLTCDVTAFGPASSIAFESAAGIASTVKGQRQ